MAKDGTQRGGARPGAGRKPKALKEKLLAALRGGIKTVLIPAENEKDLWDIPQNVKDGLQIVPVKRIDEVLERALEHDPYRFIPETPWSEAHAAAADKNAASGSTVSNC